MKYENKITCISIEYVIFTGYIVIVTFNFQNSFKMYQLCKLEDFSPFDCLIICVSVFFCCFFSFISDQYLIVLNYALLKYYLTYLIFCFNLVLRKIDKIKLKILYKMKIDFKILAVKPSMSLRYIELFYVKHYLTFNEI